MHTHLSLPVSCKVAGPSGLHDKQCSILFCTRRATGLRTKSSNNGAGEGPDAALASIASATRRVHPTQCVLAGVPKPPGNNPPKADEQWQDLAFPTYLQSEVDDFCQDWDEALQVTLQANASSPVCSLAHALPVRDEHKCVCSWKNVGSQMLHTEM